MVPRNSHEWKTEQLEDIVLFMHPLPRPITCSEGRKMNAGKAV